MKENTGSLNGWLWLTVPTGILLALAAGSGVFVKGLYRDTPNLVAQARGQDLVTLVVVLPVLAISAFLAGRGSQRARLFWLGGLIYTVYTYVGYAFSVRFNELFLVYVALLGCSTYALIGGLATTDWVRAKTNFTEQTPTKVVSIYLGILAGLFYWLWLRETIPASLSGNPPPSLREAGTPTNFIQVLDMAWLLPAVVITAVNLWRKRPLGYTLAGALLVFFVLLSLAILSMAIAMAQADQPVVIPQVVIYAVLFSLSLGIMVVYLKNLKKSGVPQRGNRR